MLWYTYKEDRSKWYKLSLEQVKEIIELNQNKELGIPLEEYESEIEEVVKVDFENVVGQDSLTRFDAPKKSRRNRNNRNKKKRVAVGANANQQNRPKQNQQNKSKKPGQPGQPRAQKKNNNQGKPKNNRRRNPNSNENQSPKE